MVIAAVSTKMITEPGESKLRARVLAAVGAGDDIIAALSDKTVEFIISVFKASLE